MASNLIDLINHWELRLGYLDGEKSNLLKIYEGSGEVFNEDERSTWHMLMKKNSKHIDNVTDTITYLRMVKE